MSEPFIHGVDEVSRFRCRWCRTEYKTRGEAEACAQRGWDPVFKPGDVVVMKSAADLSDPKPYTEVTHAQYGPIAPSPWIFRHISRKSAVGCIDGRSGRGRFRTFDRKGVAEAESYGDADLWKLLKEKANAVG